MSSSMNLGTWKMYAIYLPTTRSVNQSIKCLSYSSTWTAKEHTVKNIDNLLKAHMLLQLLIKTAAVRTLMNSRKVTIIIMTGGSHHLLLLISTGIQNHTTSSHREPGRTQQHSVKIIIVCVCSSFHILKSLRVSSARSVGSSQSSELCLIS